MRSLSFIIFIVLFFIAFNSTGLAQSPHGKNFNIDCSNCHDAKNWQIIPSKILFNHDTTEFKLTGQHKSVDCKSCHTSLIFSGVKKDCFSCHKDIHQNSVGFDCVRCHNTKSWVIPNITEIHRMSRFPLIGAHQTADCAQCHSGYSNLNFNPVGVSCIDCHRPDFNNTSSPNHLAAGFSTECQDCHNISSLTWATINVNHDFFPLIGGHKIDNCFACHSQSTFKGLSPDCYSCHRKDYESAKNPDHAVAKFPLDCQQCHNINSFIPAAFDHNSTGFPLIGAHKTVSCSGCHQNGFQATPTDCYTCHKQDYESTKDPNHVTGNFSKECSQCHNTNSWSDATIDHNQTAFPLTGAHKNVNCSSCHTNGFSNTPVQCYPCHTSNYTTAVPNHIAAGISTECQTCHNTNAWNPSDFKHISTGFELTGQHAALECSACHKGSTSGLNVNCVSCHQADYNNAPNHQAQKYPANCEMCHTTSAWIPSNFNHQTTNFPLTGAHTNVQCSSCHTNGFTGTSTTCISCHQNDYNNTTDPNHQQAGFSTECQTCHSTTSWGDAAFDHSTTGFQLLGKHAAAACQSCHTNGYTNTPTQCYSCHANSYTSATPNHTAAGISTECQTCHNTNAWNPSDFKHISTGFELTGQHAALECSACHKGSTSGLNVNCVSCHQADYNNAPNHQVQKYPTNCEMCHTTSAWIPSNFNHQTTSFPLTGAHTTVQCSSCHTNGFTGTPTTCISCHQNDYNNTTDPNHQQAGFSTECQTCHSTTSWGDAAFDHSTTGFQLLGKHATTTCQSCHTNGYTNTPTDCYSCHKTNYDNTSNPNHAAAGFPTTCEQCHNTTNWNDATFDHDGQFFPIYSGTHNGRWNTCADCHTNSNNYMIFECINCHEHNKTDTDRHHSGVRNYVYSSDACYSCHPKGRGGD